MNKELLQKCRTRVKYLTEIFGNRHDDGLLAAIDAELGKTCETCVCYKTDVCNECTRAGASDNWQPRIVAGKEA